MTKTIDILSIGEPMVEFNHLEGRQYLQGFGGDTSNFAISAVRQGASVGYISALGDDIYGQEFYQLWAREGVSAAHVYKNAEAYSGIYCVTHNEQGHHFTFFRKQSAASLYKTADLPIAAIKSAKILHLSGISLAISKSMEAACFAAVAAARSAGCLVSFDTNLRLRLWSIEDARTSMNKMLALADICLPSFDDIVAISGESDPDKLVDYCLMCGAKIVALKLGEKGALVATPTERRRIAPFPCKPVDATGAGDAFGGAFCARMIAGDDPFQAGTYAAATAALSTEGYGAVDPIPYAARVHAFVTEQKRGS